MIGPGVAAECRENKGGMHVFEDHFFPEVVDPGSDEPVPEGEQGELVITTLTKEAQPVVRYRTGDITRILPGDCPCGRTSRRIARIQGRADDMLIIRGINVYPREIEEVLLDDESVCGTYAIIVDRRADPSRADRPGRGGRHGASRDRKDEVRDRLAARLHERVRIRVAVDVRDPGTIPRPRSARPAGCSSRTTTTTRWGDPTADVRSSGARGWASRSGTRRPNRHAGCRGRASRRRP